MEDTLVFNQQITQHSLKILKHISSGFNYFNRYVQRQSTVNNYDYIDYHPNAHLLTVSLYWMILEKRETEIIPNITDLIHILKAMVNDYKAVHRLNEGIYLEFLEGSLIRLQSIKESFKILIDPIE